jgi:hypothetical protein
MRTGQWRAERALASPQQPRVPPYSARCDPRRLACHPAASATGPPRAYTASPYSPGCTPRTVTSARTTHTHQTHTPPRALAQCRSSLKLNSWAALSGRAGARPGSAQHLESCRKAAPLTYYCHGHASRHTHTPCTRHVCGRLCVGPALGGCEGAAHGAELGTCAGEALDA